MKAKVSFLTTVGAEGSLYQGLREALKWALECLQSDPRKASKIQRKASMWLETISD